MRKIIFCLSLIPLLTFVGCKKNENAGVASMGLFYSFQSGDDGWICDFADYPNEPDVETYYEFQFSTKNLPAPLDTNNGAFSQSGVNHSDDLFMFIKKKITGLLPNHEFSVGIEAEIATCIPDDMIGLGGSPGGSVYIKAGAFHTEPLKILNNSENWFRMNLDKGNQSHEGLNMKIIGNMENGSDTALWTLKIVKTSSPVNVTSNDNGEIWLILGTDSGCEDITVIYYNSISAKIE